LKQESDSVGWPGQDDTAGEVRKNLQRRRSDSELREITVLHVIRLQSLLLLMFRMIFETPVELVTPKKGSSVVAPGLFTSNSPLPKFVAVTDPKKAFVASYAEGVTLPRPTAPKKNISDISADHANVRRQMST
jgi:hypothetical protein